MSDLFEQDRLEPVVQPLSPVFRIVADAQESQVAHLLEKLVKGGRRLFPLIHVGVDLIPDNIAHRLAEHLVVLVEVHLRTRVTSHIVLSL